MMLTGIQRARLTVEWLKRGGNKFMPKKDFIKKVCEAKGIVYTEAKKVER